MSAAADSTLTTIDLQIEGMHCGACALRLEKALAAEPGVRHAEVNYATASAHLALAVDGPSEARIAEVVAATGYRVAASQTPADPTAGDPLLWLSLMVSVPFVVSMLAMLAGWHAWALPAWLQCVLATPVQFVAGARFYRGAWASIRGGLANMDVLVAIGTSAAYGLSLYNWAHGGDLYFESAVLIVALVRLGKRLEEQARLRANRDLAALLSLAPRRAWVERGGEWIEVDAAALRPGDTFRVPTGEAVPVDGVLFTHETTPTARADLVVAMRDPGADLFASDAAAQLDESMLTGESLPVGKRSGDRVFAGTLNAGALFVARASATGRDTVLAGIVRRVRAAQAAKPPIQRLADRISAVFVPAVVALACLTAGAWTLLGHGAEGLVHGIAVLVIACPCALGLATPTAILVGTSRAARRGLLFRDAAALEHAARLELLMLDKTGTLTLGRPAVCGRRVWPRAGAGTAEVALAIAQASTHPLAAAIAREEASLLAKAPPKQGLAAIRVAPAGVPRSLRVRTLPGKGVLAEIDGVEWAFGSPDWLAQRGTPVAADWLAEARTAGWSAVALADAAGVRLAWGLADPLRSDAAQALGELRSLGIALLLRSGDHEAAVRPVAERLGIDDWQAGVSVAGKADEVAHLRQQGREVGMAGDGINDAPALASASVSFAMAGGSAAAIESADVVLMRDALTGIPEAIRLSRSARRRIWQNLGFALGYNVLAIPAAALGLLTPDIAAAAMAASSLSVVGNALRRYT